MKLPPGVVGRAKPSGLEPYRYWLSRTWDLGLPKALIIGMNPNKATESHDDQMTGFLTRLLRGLEGEYICGGYTLVNCFDYRDKSPKTLLNIEEPSSTANIPTIKAMLRKCDFIVVSWGTTDYGKAFQDRRREVSQLVKESGKKAICFSPRRAPIYCSQTNANAGDGRWSSTPILWT
jgi:hypothetical protein